MKPTPKTKPCPHCAGTVAQGATKCPHCGGSLRSSSERIAFVLIILFVLALIAAAIQEAKFNDALDGARRANDELRSLY